MAITACVAFSFASAQAQVITAERAQEIANNFFQNGKQKSAAVRSTAAVSMKKSADSRILTNGSSNEAPTFHILTGADGKGFVIVSGEEIENPIIGYSFEGTIDTNNLPVGFVDYITDIDAQVKALRKYNAANPQKAAARSAMQKAADFEYNATTMGEIVVDLKTAPWGQHGPFNKLCFTKDGETALTGCGPTAFAILCYYYKWPASGVGTVTHQGTGENMELGHEYNYASMRNDNYPTGYTEEQANAVAVLMRDLGWANQVGYGPGATSFIETAQHMVDHFRFKSVRPVDHGASLAVVRETLGNDTQWKTYIKNNLNAGYPIPYSSTTGGELRHIYILDGYTDKDYYHFNWGWNGNGNGWFTLDNMVPDNTSNYSNSHKAYYIIPDATTYTVTATVNDSNMGTVSINNGTAGSTATANLMQGVTATLTAHPVQGYALASWTKNGVVVGSRNTIQVTVGTDANEYVANFADESTVTIVKDYTISSTTGELTNDGTSATKFSQWASKEEPVLKLNATCGETVANSMSIVNDVLQLYAYDYDKANGYTYTIKAPDGYLITSYSLTYYMSSSFNITVSNGTTTQTASKSDQTLSASGLSKESASFTLTGTAANNLVKVRSFTVTIQKEGANVPSTPTTYTINVTTTPGTGGTATVNGNSSATVTEGESVTLAAAAANGYIFTGWYKGAEKVSGNANYTFYPTESASYEARFVAKAVSNCNIPTDNTLRYYRFAIAIAKNSYTTDFGGNYENVKQFWQECEDFMNEVYVPLGMCFDVVIDQRLLLGTDLPINNSLPDISGVTDLINNAIGSGSYDIGLCISYRDDSEENTGLSAVNGAYSSTTKANGYAQADKWVVAHEAGHLFGADHTTEGESSLMDNIGEFFSYPSIKKIRDASVNSGPGNAYKSEVVANNAPTFTAQMKNTYRIPKGACLSIPVYASDADGHSLRYAAIGCSSSTVGKITGGGTMPHFASLKPQTSNIIDYSPKFVADGDSYYLPVDGTNIPSMSAGSYSIAILVNDMPEGNSYDYLNSNPFYSNYDVWDATVEIVDGNPFTASISPAQNSYTAGSNVTVTWGVNNSVFTEDSRVRITMSTDYGKTFSHVLADDVRALDGSKAVTLPNVNVGNVDVDFSNKYVNAVRSMRAGIIRVEVIDGAAYTLTTLSPENGGGFNITGGGAEPDPTPTTYAITTAANPAEGGTAKFSVGTGSKQTQGDVNSGELITLYAVANDGYKFVNWTLNSTEVSKDATCNVTASQAANYVANFEAEATTPAVDLSGRYFRLKVKNTTNYMNIANTNHNDGATSGVTVVAKNESSDTQIFLFEQSGDGYKLKANSGNYIKCHAWNANANTTSASDATVLTFEPTGNELEYFIKWDNTNMNQGVERDDYFKAENGYVFCDAAIGSATTWVLEEVIPSNEKTLTVTYSGATWNNESSGWWVSVVTNTTPAVTVKTTDGTPKIGFSTFNEVRHPYLLDGNSFTISVPANCKITGYRLGYQAHNLVSKSVTYTNGKESTGIVTITQSNEQNTLTVTGLDNNEISFSVEDQTTQAGFIIKSLEITYVENEFEPAMFKAEIENWRNDNPNTHLGTITIGGTAMKLTPEHLNASELAMPVVEGTTLAFTRKYRGFEFQGFYIGSTELGKTPTLTADNVAAIDENNPLIAKFTATDDVTLFYDDDQYSYRIPAIAKTGNGMLVAVSDYRHNLDDIGRDNHGTGTKRIDLVMRTSTDNGATWSETKTIAAGDNSKVDSYLRAFGDAAIAAVGQNIVVMAAAGDVVYTAGTTSSPNKMARIYSTDNGATWTIEETTTKMYSQSTSLIPSGGSAFFGSGKLAVDPNFNGTGNARIYGALLVRIGTDGYNNFGVFSDDLGATWKILGGDNTNPVAKGDEPKVEILPNGQILLSARRGGGRVFRVFTYGDDKANGAGSWGDAAVNGCDNGGSNATNGDIICLDAKRPNGKPTKILLQSQPKGGSGQYDRKDVTIWYKEVSADETYTSATIASGWTMGKQVSTVQSSYSAMALQANGEIALFFEEAPCYGNDYTKGYSMVYAPLTIEEITGENFLNPNADVEYVPVEFNIELTDTEGNIYRETLDYIPNNAAAVATYLTTTYPFITLGENGAIADNTYTNTVTLPFKVSNANTTVWHNIYFPANGTSAGEYYPIYLMAENENATAVAKITEKVHYGNSQYNTYNYADELAWAVYNVNEGFTFKFKNKLTGKFMAVTGVSSDDTNNVVYTYEAGATAFTLEKYTGGNASYGNYAIKSVYNSTTGYVCNTSVGYTYATNYPDTGHPGAWVKFVESPDYWTIYNQLIADINNFGTGNGKYTENDAINNIDIDALASMPLNSLNTKAEEVQNVKESYTEITLTVPAVNDVVPGSVKILGEEVSHKFVQKGEITIQAAPAAGYRFVNWTRPAAAASAAARTAEARNSDVVSTDNPYTVTVSEALSLEANFEQIVANVTLNDIQGNTYKVTLSGLTGEVNAETLEAKLKAEYPFIEEFGINPTFADNGNSYTYTNSVKLMFKVSKTTDDPKTDNLWHNIYYPTNANGRPNYLSASTTETTLVEKVNDGTYNYGANPTYNTMEGNPKIAWAIYNVNNSFEFIFKNELTGKYIKVASIASSDAQNVEFVEKAEATAFTFLGDAGTYNGDYALVAKIGEETGYLCSTSLSYGWATHHNSNTDQGAWMKIKEADYTDFIRALDERLLRFDTGNGNYLVTDEFQIMIDSLVYNKEQIRLNQFNTYFDAIDKAVKTWPKISLTITPENKGTTNIGGEENVVHKYVPTGDLTIEAVPVEGYHFVKWIDGTNEVKTAAYTKNISGGKDDVIALTAEFAINIYNINLTAGEGGSASASAATVEHGSEVTLTATPSTNYSFAGWYDGENLISAEANYTFTVTSDINYTARFSEAPTGTVAIHITVASTDGTTVTNAEDGNVKAIINNLGLPWPTSAEFTVGTDVNMVATEDYDLKAYLFDGWYKNDVLVSKDLEITVKATENATYEARFFRGCVVVGKSNKNSWGNITQITYEDGTQIGLYAATTRVVVKEGTIVKINTYTNNGYRLGSWTDDEGNEVGTEDNLVVEATKDVTYTANFEQAFYYLTVRANNDAYGSAEAESGTSLGTTVKVGLNMTATLRATKKDGYKFVNWTKGENVVSSDAEYTVPAIGNAANMADVEYVANFIEVEAAEAGVYYRIGYDGFSSAAAAGAARAGATRAAGDTYTYAVNYGTGTSNNVSNSKAQEWVYKNNTNEPTLTLRATFADAPAYAINMGANATANPKLYTHNDNSNTETPVKYTLAVSEDYIITNYRFEYFVYYNNYGFTINGTSPATKTWLEFSSGDVNAQTAEFAISSTNKISYMIVRNFTVTIQPVGGESEGGGETPEPEPGTPSIERYYMQSVASNVSGKANALLMTQDTGASSIFYYADSKLLSYDKGTYIKEDGNTRGLLGIGVKGGNVTINKAGETSTIAAPSYLHANETDDKTIRFVDHCGSDNGDKEHNLVIEEVESLPVTISAAEHATLYAPVALKIPDGVKAYILKEQNFTAGTYATMTSLKNGIIPPNTGVILKGAPNNYDFVILDNDDTDVDNARVEAIDNVLEGTVAATHVTKDAYILASRNGKVGLYPLAGNSYLAGGTTPTFTNNSHKAYLPVEGNFGEILKNSNGFHFIFDDDNVTDIDGVEAEETETIYDLQGRKLSEITEPGIYIVNGKKIFVK